MVVVVRHGHDILHPVTGTKIDEVKRLAADFGVHRGEFTYTDPETGMSDRYADISGGFFDLDAYATANDITEDEKEAMRRHLVRKAETNPDYVQIHNPTAVAAPWPTYDTTHHFAIPKLALQLGLVEHALVYEQQTKNRDSIVKALQENLGAVPEPEVVEPEPVREEDLTPAA